MVDSTKGIGPMQGLISGTRVAEPNNARRNTEVKETSNPQDEVKISPKALSLSQAEDVAGKIKVVLESSDYSLGLKSGFDESL